MQSPYFRNRRWYHQPDLTSYHPGYRVDPIHEFHRSTQPERSSGPKIVRIPVHFVGSKKLDRTGAAVKIQKMFRGFSVRKCLTKVKNIGLQVDEIENKFSNREIVELLRSDAKERLRMNETLMSLLLNLDSISGVDFGVRGCRKAVIRKVIALQERIDAIVAADLTRNGNGDGVTEIRASVEIENSNNSDQPTGASEGSGDLKGAIECLGQGNDDNHDGEEDVVDVGVDCEVNVENQGNGTEYGNREWLERMMEESEKMTKLMTQLYERNEMQTKMLNALTNRVEMLEKAFLCDRLRRKKKRAKNATPCNEN